MKIFKVFELKAHFVGKKLVLLNIQILKTMQLQLMQLCYQQNEAKCMNVLINVSKQDVMRKMSKKLSRNRILGSKSPRWQICFASK
jgi:hypothetical protein